MQYAQLNESGEFAHYIIDPANIEWDSTHLCPVASLTPAERDLFRVVEVEDNQRPEFNALTHHCVMAGAELVDEAWREKWVVVALDVGYVKSVMTGMVKSRRDTLEQSGFGYLGHPIDSDPVSVQRIAIAVQAAQIAHAAAQPFNIGWKCKDDHTLQLDAAGMMGTAVALATYANALHLHSRSLQETIDGAEDGAALLAIEITDGWPS